MHRVFNNMLPHGEYNGSFFIGLIGMQLVPRSRRQRVTRAI